MQNQNQPDLEVGDINWSLTAKNVPGKPRKLTKSWTVPWVVKAKVAGVLYRIKPYNDGNSLPPSIIVHVGRLKIFNLADTARYMPLIKIEY